MSKAKDKTGPAFPCEAEGFSCGLIGMTYRQWLAGQIASTAFSNNEVIQILMKHLKTENRNNDVIEDESTTQHRVARMMAKSVWRHVDALLATENET